MKPKQIILLLFFIFIISNISFVCANTIYTPQGYYNFKKFQQSSNEFYYSDVCNNTIPNSDGAIFLAPSSFPKTPQFNANLLITKGTNMESPESPNRPDYINILCIEGSLKLSGIFSLSLGAIVILPGGSLIMDSHSISFRDLDPSSSLIDPLNFFPGLLALGGSLIFKGNHISYLRANRIDDHTLSMYDPASTFNTSLSKIHIYSENYINGQTCSFIFDPILKHLNLDSVCLPILEGDKSISIYFPNDVTVPIIESTSTTGASIYITGDTKVHIENYRFSHLGKTDFKPYNDTQLVFSPNDSNTVTEILIGTNQRDRNSLFIEFSNNSNITGCLFEENKETISPLVFHQSNAIINKNLVSSKSGSSVLVQNQDEVIQSSNNWYYLLKPNSNQLILGEVGSGYGIYSLSSNFLSSSDNFIGHSNAFNFDFKTTSNELVNVTTTSFNITNTYFPLLVDNGSTTSTESSDRNLVSINSEDTSNYIFNSLTATEPIKININGNSTLKFNGLIASDGFSINGKATRLDILNSKFLSEFSSNPFKSVKSLSISNSYVFGEIGSIKSDDEIYGSNITPFYYNDINVLPQLNILSIYPNVPLQMGINNTLNVIIKIATTTAIPLNQLSCTASGSIVKQVTVSADSTNGGCLIPVHMSKEGSVNLRITINDNNDNKNLYSFDLPEIIVYNYYKFYYGLRFTDPNAVVALKSEVSASTVPSSETIIVDGNSYQNGCNQENNCTISSDSNNNIKFRSDLPNVTGSNELNVLFSSGITTTVPNQPINFNLMIDSNVNVYQIQLFFTHIPTNQQNTPLSVYIQDKPVYLLEPLNGAAPSFKNKTFIYENANSLSSIKISVISNGDIYLTSLAAFSIIIPPIIIPTIPSITTSTGGTNPPTPDGTNSNTPALAIGLSVGLSSLAIISVVSLIIYFKNKNSIHSKKPKDVEENIKTTTTSTVPLSTATAAITTTTVIITNGEETPGAPTPIQTRVPTPTHTPVPTPIAQPLITSVDQQFFNPLAVIPPAAALKKNFTEKRRRNDEPIEPQYYSSFPTIQSDSTDTKFTYIPFLLLNRKRPSEKYKTHPNIVKTLTGMKYFEPEDPEFPLKFDQTIMDFAYGLKCRVGEPYIGTLYVSNTSSKHQNGYLIFPVADNTGVCTTTSNYFQVNSHDSIFINIALTLTCTTNYFQNFAVVLDGVGYTYITIHMESELSVKLDFTELEFDEFIGEGSYGVVFRGKWRSQIVAIKFIKISDRITNIDEIYREMDILSKLKSPFVVSFIGGIVSAENLCVVTEYITLGSLGDLIHSKRHVFTKKQKVRFALDISKGMNSVHKGGIIHRDLKPDNILVVDTNPNAEVCVKISDFGTSREANERNRRLTKAIGTPIYMSDEALENRPYNKSTDVYSFAITLYEIMTGVLPFSEYEQQWDIPNKIVKGLRPTLGLDYVDTRIKDIIERGWGIASNRPTFEDIVNELEEIYQEIILNS